MFVQVPRLLCHRGPKATMEVPEMKMHRYGGIKYKSDWQSKTQVASQIWLAAVVYGSLI